MSNLKVGTTPVLEFDKAKDIMYNNVNVYESLRPIFLERMSVVIKAVIFDMGGTIINHQYSPERAVMHAANTMEWLKDYGIHIPESPEDFARKLQEADQKRRRANEQEMREMPPLEAVCKYYLRDYHPSPEVLFPIAEEFCFRYYNDCFEAKPARGLLECVSGLRKQGMRLGIISNTLSRTYMISKLAEFGVSGYFEYVLLSSVCGLRKPDPAIFELCRTTMGLKRSEMAYVGDTISRDVIGTLRAGWELMIRIAAPNPRPYVAKREQALENCGYQPHYFIQTLPEVVKIIRAKNAELGFDW